MAIEIFLYLGHLGGYRLFGMLLYTCVESSVYLESCHVEVKLVLAIVAFYEPHVAELIDILTQILSEIWRWTIVAAFLSVVCYDEWGSFKAVELGACGLSAIDDNGVVVEGVLKHLVAACSTVSGVALGIVRTGGFE